MMITLKNTGIFLTLSLMLAQALRGLEAEDKQLVATVPVKKQEIMLREMIQEEHVELKDISSDEVAGLEADMESWGREAKQYQKEVELYRVNADTKKSIECIEAWGKKNSRASKNELIESAEKLMQEMKDLERKGLIMLNSNFEKCFCEEAGEQIKQSESSAGKNFERAILVLLGRNIGDETFEAIKEKLAEFTRNFSLHLDELEFVVMEKREQLCKIFTALCNMRGKFKHLRRMKACLFPGKPEEMNGDAVAKLIQTTNNLFPDEVRKRVALSKISSISKETLCLYQKIYHRLGMLIEECINARSQKEDISPEENESPNTAIEHIRKELDTGMRDINTIIENRHLQPITVIRYYREISSANVFLVVGLIILILGGIYYLLRLSGGYEKILSSAKRLLESSGLGRLEDGVRNNIVLTLSAAAFNLLTAAHLFALRFSAESGRDLLALVLTNVLPAILLVLGLLLIFVELLETYWIVGPTIGGLLFCTAAWLPGWFIWKGCPKKKMSPIASSAVLIHTVFGASLIFTIPFVAGYFFSETLVVDLIGWAGVVSFWFSLSHMALDVFNADHFQGKDSISRLENLFFVKAYLAFITFFLIVAMTVLISMGSFSTLFVSDYGLCATAFRMISEISKASAAKVKNIADLFEGYERYAEGLSS
jgi:hypothetical protein